MTASSAGHASHTDQLMARTLGVCWHSPTSDRWPCIAASGADRECPHNEDRASCAAGCGADQPRSLSQARRLAVQRAGQPTPRDQLAEALPESLGPVGLRRRAVPELDVPGELTGYGQVLLDALLPLIEADRERAKAEALEQAARTLRKSARELAGDHRTVAEGCAAIVTAHGSDARAASLRATTGQLPDGTGT